MINRIFKAFDRFGAETEFELRTPTFAIENEGERHYRVAYSQALSAGVFPRNKMREVMKRHGMWTDEDDKNLKTELAQMAILQIELEQSQQAGNQEKCVEIAQNISKCRGRMWELFMIQQSVYMNSAEGMAELVKAEAIMAACVQIKATGKKYWKNYTEFVTERDENDKSTVFAKAVEVQNEILLDIRNKIEEDQPENKYLKDIKSRMMDREIQEKVEEELNKRAAEALKKADGEQSNTKDQIH